MIYPLFSFLNYAFFVVHCQVMPTILSEIPGDNCYVLLLQVTTETMLDHAKKLLQIPGSRLLFGGEALQNHSIPKIYGAIKPTAIFVPLEEILKDEHYPLVTKEIFGPFQVIEYSELNVKLGNFLADSSNLAVFFP